MKGLLVKKKVWEYDFPMSKKIDLLTLNSPVFYRFRIIFLSDNDDTAVAEETGTTYPIVINISIEESEIEAIDGNWTMSSNLTEG